MGSKLWWNLTYCFISYYFVQLDKPKLANKHCLYVMKKEDRREKKHKQKLKSCIGLIWISFLFYIYIFFRIQCFLFWINLQLWFAWNHIALEPFLSTLPLTWAYDHSWCCCLSIFQVDHSVVDRNTFISIPQLLHNVHKQTETFSLTSSYGLFRV